MAEAYEYSLLLHSPHALIAVRKAAEAHTTEAALARAAAKVAEARSPPSRHALLTRRRRTPTQVGCCAEYTVVAQQGRCSRYLPTNTRKQHSQLMLHISSHSPTSA
jgi:hypothetical protein